MAADPHRLFMSVEEYLAFDHSSLDERYEFIDGIVTMLAGGTVNHSRISVNLIVALNSLLRGKSCMVYNSYGHFCNTLCLSRYLSKLRST